jgi:hypothetical protein
MEPIGSFSLLKVPIEEGEFERDETFFGRGTPHFGRGIPCFGHGTPRFERVQLVLYAEVCHSENSLAAILIKKNRRP